MGTIPPSYSFVTGIRQYNEDAFRHWDQLIQIANQNGVRVVIRVLSSFGVNGGKENFCALRGLPESAFFKDPNVIADTKDLMSYILNRKNFYTGILYKDDPAIAAFSIQTEGASNSATDNWTMMMSAYFKTIDHNHLFVDGRYGPRNSSLNDPNMDIIDDHIYKNDPSIWVSTCKKDMKACRGHKAFMIGECGYESWKTLDPHSVTKWQAFLDTAINNGTSLVFIWRLVAHDRDGGIVGGPTIHSGVSSQSFAWPGSAVGEANYGEIDDVDLTERPSLSDSKIAHTPGTCAFGSGYVERFDAQCDTLAEQYRFQYL